MNFNGPLFISHWGAKLAKKLAKPITKFKPPITQKKWNIVRGDMVEVIQGPQVGQRGKVQVVIRQKNRVIVEGVNMRRRIVKKGADGTPGKIITRACSVHYSNVMLIDPTTNKPSKIARRFLEDGTRVRVSKLSGEIIPKPDPFAGRPPRSTVVGPKDTLAQDVFTVTFSDYEKYLPYIYEKLKISSDEQRSK